MNGLSIPLLTVAVVVACAAPEPSEEPRAPAGTAAAGAAVQPFRPGIRFDPVAVSPGTRVGDLVIESVEARPTVIGPRLVGTARFGGELTLSGETMANPDADLRGKEVCFEADSAGAARMPRWAGDERRPWFCLENSGEAAATLSPPGSEGRRATIVVDRFTIHSGHSDEVNSARLVRVLAREAGAADPRGGPHVPGPEE